MLIELFIESTLEKSYTHKCSVFSKNNSRFYFKKASSFKNTGNKLRRYSYTCYKAP